MPHYADRLQAAIDAKGGAPVVVGVDPVLERLPADLRPTNPTAPQAAEALERFGRAVIEAVAPHAPAVKINSAFFEAFYEHGVAAYYRLIEHAHAHGLLAIGDIKRGDIGSTARLYARGHLATPGAAGAPDARISDARIPDAVTLAGYLGENAVRPFIEAAQATGRGLYVLVRPSDPGADRVHEFAGQPAPASEARPAADTSHGASGSAMAGAATRFYQHMAALVREWGGDPALIGSGGLSCVGAVVAPKDEPSTRALRSTMPHTPWLVPGYGAQGATREACAACLLPGGGGAVINASRSVIYAFEQEAYQARFGADWRAAIAAAAEAFAGDMRTLRG